MQSFRQKCNQPTNSKINYYSYRLQQYKQLYYVNHIRSYA